MHINRIKRLSIIFAILFYFSVVSEPVIAQETYPQGTLYIVQAGDSLWSIAQRFRVSIEELSQLNNITNTDQLIEGISLIIPGLEGVEGILNTRQVAYGESMRSLSRLHNLSMESIAKLNHVICPSELYAGSSLVVPENEASEQNKARILIPNDQTLLELAVIHNNNPWNILLENRIEEVWRMVPGDILLLSGKETTGPIALPEVVYSIEINPNIPLQGKTMIIRVKSSREVKISGSFLEHPLNFFSEDNGSYVALQGIHALNNPGIYPLNMQIDMNDQKYFKYSQMINVGMVDYPFDRPLTVDKATIDPNITEPENELWFSLVAPSTDEKMWNGTFKLPSPLPLEYCLDTGDCWSSRFGNRRSYNGSAYEYFHTGLDIFGGNGTEIYAPARGIVVFAGPLTIRGNATLIDHGWGVYTGYMHQSDIYVTVGDEVEIGDLIGIVGETGRVEGAHLHWEVLVGGIQVDPLDWLSQVYP